jgi:hypothetical protein
MAFNENYRVRYFVRDANGSVRDSGWDLIQQEQHGEMWEPADTILARGSNGPTKRITDTRVINHGEIAGTPLNSNVFYPRTGTAG